MMKIGVVLFDDGETNTTGWACAHGQEARRIQGVAELDSDTIWVTNIPSRLIGKTGISRHAFFRSSEFLQIPVDQILAEVGASPDPDLHGETPGRAACMAATIIERVVRLYCHAFHTPRAQWRPHPFDLRGQMRENLLPTDPVIPDDHQRIALQNALQHYSKCDVKVSFDEDRIFMPMYVPRLAHLKALLRTPIPATDEWTKYPRKRGMQGDAVLEWVGNAPGPILARTTVHRVDPRMAEMINYGGMASTIRERQKKHVKSYSASQEWATSEELFLLAPFADMTIHEAYTYTKHTRLIDQGPIADWVGALTEYDEISYSLGVFAHLLWSAATANHARFPHEHVSVNMMNPFLRAADRLHCLRHALRLRDQGELVTGYGSGRIHVHMDRDARVTGAALRVASQAGLLTTMPMVSPESPVSIPPMVERSESESVVFELLGHGMRNEWMGIDEEIVDLITPRDKAVMKPQEVRT